MIQKSIRVFFLKYFLILDEILPVLEPSLCKALKPFTRKFIAFIAMGDAFLLTAEMKCGALFTSLVIDPCPRTGIFFTCIGGAPAAEYRAGRHTAIVVY